MTYPSWPQYVPQPRRDGHGLRPNDARRRRAADVGAPVYEPRLTLVPDLMTVTVTVTGPQKAIFDQFFRVTCAQGTSYFWMPDPTRDGWPLLDDDFGPLLFEDGTPWTDEARLLCAWGDNLPSEGNWRGQSLDVSFDLWVMP